jgi:Methyltransferase domain
MLQKYKYLAIGCLTYIPGLHAALHRGTGGTNSARYCYAVWMRHLVRNRGAGAPSAAEAVAELGPGDSLGIGLMALLCGVERYVALDAVPHARSEANLAIFDQLVALLRGRTDIPDDREFPQLKPALESYAFPGHLLPDELLARCLDRARVERLRADLQCLSGSVRYASAWWQADCVEPESVDLILSQAVLEHVNDLDSTYRAMHGWLRRDGFMSHQVDLKCHETATAWNGHLAYSDFTWRLMRGRLPYLLNRVTASGHVAAAERAGFTIVGQERARRHDGLPRERLAPRFRDLPDDDLTAAGLYLQCRK